MSQKIEIKTETETEPETKTKKAIEVKPRKSKNKPVQCLFCMKVLHGGLHWHIQSVHINDKPLKCKIEGCNMGFNRNGFLIEHMRSRHGIKYQKAKMECPFAKSQGCTKTFGFRHLLKIHITNKHNEDDIRLTLIFWTWTTRSRRAKLWRNTTYKSKGMKFQ